MVAALKIERLHQANQVEVLKVGTIPPFGVFPEIHPFLGSEASHVDRAADDDDEDKTCNL